MALIAKSTSFLIFAAYRDIIVYDSEKKTYTRTTVTPAPVTEKRESAKGNDNDDEIDSDNEQKNSSNEKTSGQIQHLAVSPCGNLLAITTFGDKLLHTYRIQNDGSLELLSQRKLVRGSGGLRFTPDSKLILLADKTGDCYSYDSIATDEPGKWILGHFSMVLDILMTPDLQFIITCDRDEKIRVTRYPRTEIIETYCLGHLEFVAAIELLPSTSEPLLVSVSGDKTLRLWNYISGEELLRQQLSAPGLKVAVNHKNHVTVVLLENPIKVVTYELTQSGNDFSFTELVAHSLNKDVKYVNSVLYNSDHELLLTSHSDNEEIGLIQLSLESLEENSKLQYVEVVPEDFSEIVRNNLPALKVNLLEDVSILFKKKFDNLKDYHEKKRRRIEEKAKKL